MKKISEKNSADKPIGVFDSGIGGLTVLSEIAKLLPYENTVYLGDTARVPYGSKSKETVVRYAFEDAAFLLKHDIKLLVVACNTASAYALTRLEKQLHIPVVGVIRPGAKAAVAVTKTKKIGVIGTEGTIKSSAYTKTINTADRGIKTYTSACPLFVPLVEEGWTNNKIALGVAKEYLSEIKNIGIDTLVLGCTHYPLLKDIINKVMGNKVKLIDSAEATAGEVKRMLSESGQLTRRKTEARHKFFVTDSPERFIKVGKKFFGVRLSKAKLARLEGN
ncbi:glutamate racemase [bacterium]|nr:MAG: glutamate racemase [bacterium]